MFGGDVLKICYLVAMGDESMEDASLLQGFGRGWRAMGWALPMLAGMPADVLENASDLDSVIAQRMGGMRQLAWLPLMISPIEATKIEDFGVFVVVLSNEPEVTKRVSIWIMAQSSPALHITPLEAPGTVHPKDLTQAILNAYCKRALAQNLGKLSASEREAAHEALDNWLERDCIPSGLKQWGHNVVIPNHMSLDRASRSMEPGEAFVGKSEEAYVDIILESAIAVGAIRKQVGLRSFHALSLLRPGIILTEPALFRNAYKRIRLKDDKEAKAVTRVIQMLQKQTGLFVQTDIEFLNLLESSPAAQQTLQMRQFELETHSFGVGLRAAQTCSSVVRLSPAVNRVFAELSAFARSVRSRRPETTRKAKRLFQQIQNELANAIGPKRLAYIAEQRPSIKIVADAPMEWLLVNGLPLSLRLDCSRINATPGNLMMGLLTHQEVLTFSPRDLQRVLILSSFDANDPLRKLLVDAVAATSQGWAGKVEVIFRKVQTTAEFVAELNLYSGAILIFDGHGAANDVDPIGSLKIGSDEVDIWSLRGAVRVPPIVILSACDTHGIDSSTHATVGNGFLALGARTVVATMLPIDGRGAAMFIARLIYRLADFLPAALKARGTVLCWTEVISGMLRMLLVSEILDALVGWHGAIKGPRGRMQSSANIEINTYDCQWFEKLVDRIALHRGENRRVIQSGVAGIIAQSEAIRYVQLGSPETILIDDGSIRAMFVAKQHISESDGAE